MDQAISSKNTKNEILAAYDALLAEVKAAKKTSRQQKKIQEQEQGTRAAVQQYAPQNVHEQVALLKKRINDDLKSITEQFDTEYEKFSQLQKAITIEEKQLQESYEIAREAHTLDTLLLAQQRKKETFDQEMAQKKETFEKSITEQKSQWEKQREIVKLTHKEEKEQQQKQWKREKEEYDYRLKREREKDTDAYTVKKITQEIELTEQRVALEAEFKERGAAIAASEEELQTLRQKAESFPAQLQKAIDDTQKQVTKQLEQRYEYEKNLLLKEVEGKQKLSEQMIASLQQKIKEQDNQIHNLTERSNHATVQVQDIAVKAIEGASSIKPLYHQVDGRAYIDKNGQPKSNS